MILIMRPIKDYSKVRLAIVGFGVGMIAAALRTAVVEVFHIGSSSSWSPFVTGAITGVVVVATLGYYGKTGRDKELLRKGGRT
jgi:peptidoglycan biosynthesis protein MviN/MurJ (putative lipid II flippase)